MEETQGNVWRNRSTDVGVSGDCQMVPASPKRTAIYVHVTSGQPDAFSVVVQQAECELYTGTHDCTVVDVFKDRSRQRASFDRPGLCALRAAVQQGAYDVVLVAAVDCLARCFADQTALIMEFDLAGVALHIVHTNMVTETHTNQALRHVTQATVPTAARRMFDLYKVGDEGRSLTAVDITHRLSQPTPYVVSLRVALYACAKAAKTRKEQALGLHTAALAAGWAVTRSAEDATGSMGLDRPGLTVLRDATRAGTIEVVLATGLDRLAQNTSDLAVLRDELQAAGCAIVILTSGPNTMGTVDTATAYIQQAEQECSVDRSCPASKEYSL